MFDQKWIDVLKTEMIEAVDVLNFDNLHIQKELLEKQLTVLQSLKDLNDFKETHNIVTKLTPSTDSSKDVVEKEKEAEKQGEVTTHVDNSSKAVSNKPVYEFERKLAGGFIPEIKGFVPEGIVRRLGIEHGDLLFATQMDTNEPNSRFFRYEIAEKGDGKDPDDRVQLNFCPVKKEAGYLVVDKSEETGQFIRYDDNFYTIILNEQEVRDLKITEGSLIDIAFPVGRPDLAKAIWNHKIEENEEFHVLSSVKSSSSKKADKTDKKSKTVFEQTLEGMSVLVIGNERMKPLYKYAVEQRGGTFLWSDAKEKLVRLEPLVRKSDLVVFLLGVSGHIGMEHIKQMCKDYDVPFETTWSKGQSTVIRIAEELQVETA